MHYKQSYKKLIIWIIWFMASFFSLPFLPIDNIAFITRLSLNYLTLNITLLMFIIYKTEAIYWFNGTTYEEALNAGSQRRKAFALRHLQFFGYFTLSFFFVSILLHAICMPYWIDMTICFIGLIAVALSTNTIKL